MTALHDELVGDSRGGACKLCTFLSRLSPTDRAEWEYEIALHDQRGEYEVTHSAIVVALKRRGVSIEEASVRRHRGNHVIAR